MHELLKKLSVPPFQCLPLLASGRFQTIAAAYLFNHWWISDKNYHVIPLADGDKIVVIENRPPNWQPGNRIVLLVHGLAGSARSNYMLRLCYKLNQAGFLVIRMNLRGCGLGLGLAKHLYHSGRSEDTRAVLLWLRKRFPQSKVTQIGFSLGANITLIMAGEASTRATENLDSLIAVSPPLDLAASVKLITHKKNKIFNDYFVKRLRLDVHLLHQFYPELPLPALPEKLNLFEFDDLYTAPRSGFKDAQDYYERCSSKHYIESIQLPTFILYAKDDPFISRQPFLRLPKKNNLDLFMTSKGGHVGWLGYTGKSWSCCWMDKILVRWLEWFTHRLK